MKRTLFTSIVLLAGSLLAYWFGLAPTAIARDFSQKSVSVPGRCHMGQCLERDYLGKVLLATAGDAKLYAVSLTVQLVPMGSTASEAGVTPTEVTHYVYCSTQNPTYMIPFEGEYYASSLNPGGDNWSGASMDAHWMYWAACHDEIAWDLSSEALQSQAIDLGYSLDLEETSYTIGDPFEVLEN